MGLGSPGSNWKRARATLRATRATWGYQPLKPQNKGRARATPGATQGHLGPPPPKPQNKGKRARDFFRAA